jgi:hypothetical protein
MCHKLKYIVWLFMHFINLYQYFALNCTSLATQMYFTVHREMFRNIILKW